MSPFQTYVQDNRTIVRVLEQCVPIADTKRAWDVISEVNARIDFVAIDNKAADEAAHMQWDPYLSEDMPAFKKHEFLLRQLTFFRKATMVLESTPVELGDEIFRVRGIEILSAEYAEGKAKDVAELNRLFSL